MPPARVCRAASAPRRADAPAVQVGLPSRRPGPLPRVTGFRCRNCPLLDQGASNRSQVIDQLVVPKLSAIWCRENPPGTACSTSRNTSRKWPCIAAIPSDTNSGTCSTTSGRAPTPTSPSHCCGTPRTGIPTPDTRRPVPGAAAAGVASPRSLVPPVPGRPRGRSPATHSVSKTSSWRPSVCLASEDKLERSQQALNSLSVTSLDLWRQLYFHAWSPGVVGPIAALWARDHMVPGWDHAMENA